MSSSRLPPFNHTDRLQYTEPPNPEWRYGESIYTTPIGKEWADGEKQGWKHIDASTENSGYDFISFA
jgi:hypothetical protein